MPPSLPTVSVLMGAYNYEQYVGRALESALTQEYPPELLEIVVVNDGSTDSTPQIVEDLARRHPGRIRLINQANGGYISSTNRAIAEARGELLALLDADDVWRSDKTRRQVELFQADPAVGLVFSEMRVVDAQEQDVRPPLLHEFGGLPERPLAALLHNNFATQSSIMVRASLRDAFAPIPPEIPYADWYIAMRIAERARFDYSPEPLALYRMHGANLTMGTVGSAAVREHKKAVALQLWALRHLPLDYLTPEELVHAWRGVEMHASFAAQHAGSAFVDLTERQPVDSGQADARVAEADEAAAREESLLEARLALKALAWDPYRLELRQRLCDSANRAHHVAERATIDLLDAARPYRLLVDVRELLAGDDLILAYAETLRGADDVTLVIDASHLSPQTVEPALLQLVDRCELEERTDIDLVAVVGPQTELARQRMLGQVQGRYSRHERHRDGLPVVTPASLSLIADEDQLTASSGKR